MAKSLIGIDIGHKTLKLTCSESGVIKKAKVFEFPDYIVEEGNITSYDDMGFFIRKSMIDAGMSADEAALVLNSDQVFIKLTEMPVMTVDQLKLNLPFEFSDYISDNSEDDYIYDYIVIDNSIQTEEGEYMRLLAAAAPKEHMENMRNMLKKAGLKLVMAAPTEYSYIGALRNCGFDKDQIERCIVDIGYNTIHLYIFKGDDYLLTRYIDKGMQNVEEAIAELFGVDEETAHEYFNGNHENCIEDEACIEVYDDLIREIQRAINFYRFNNPDSDISDIWICGIGAFNKPLYELLNEKVDLDVHIGSELLEKSYSGEEGFMFVKASGIIWG